MSVEVESNYVISSDLLHQSLGPSCFLTDNAIKMKCEDHAIVKEIRCKRTRTYCSEFLNKRIAGNTNIRFESSRSDFGKM